jgi:hypothetical protein
MVGTARGMNVDQPRKRVGVKKAGIKHSRAQQPITNLEGGGSPEAFGERHRKALFAAVQVFVWDLPLKRPL